MIAAFLLPLAAVGADSVRLPVGVPGARCSVIRVEGPGPKWGTPAWSAELLRSAHAVVRATAIGPVPAPTDSAARATADSLERALRNRPGSLLRGGSAAIVFHVREVLRAPVAEVSASTDRGAAIGTISDTLHLPGILVEQDDFNDHPAPYTFVRPSGRSGGCFTRQYRAGAQYLLLLQWEAPEARWTILPAALAPVNEQVRSSKDPWVRWARRQLARGKDR